jgi:electron transport complex protein RnfB
MPLDPPYGREQTRSAALIEEPVCIGCTLCIQACPTDAIIGAAKRMHSVVTEWCSGCELCVPACPVDCIVMLPLAELARSGDSGASQLLHDRAEDLAPLWRHRYHERNARRSLEQKRRDARLAAKATEKLAALANAPASDELTRKRAAIEAALARARTRRRPA